MADRTKHMMAAALKKKMMTKPLQKITIQEIVDDCSLNRQTFYYHFRDIYDLLHWMFEADAQKILEDRLTTETWADSLLQVLRYLEDNSRVCLSALDAMQIDALNRFLYTDVEPLVKEVIEEAMAGEKIDERYKEFVIHFYTLSLAAVIVDWLRGTRKDLQIPARELVRLIDVTVGGSLQNAMTRYREAFPESDD